MLHKLVKPIHSLHVLGVLPDGHRAIKSDTLDCTTHPFPVRVHLRLDTMEGGIEGHQPCVKPAHNEDVIVSKVVVGVARESPSCQALEQRGGTSRETKGTSAMDLIIIKVTCKVH